MIRASWERSDQGSRDALVRSRTLLIHHVRGIAKSFGARLPSCSADRFPTKVEASFPELLRPALLPLFDTIASFTQQIRGYNRRIHSLCQTQYPESQLLRQVPGVGYLTALAYLLTLEDPWRFRKSREVGVLPWASSPSKTSRVTAIPSCASPLA